MAIYTRTGDKGKTSLMGGKRVLKSDERVEAYGTVDELNSVIGMVLSELTADKKFVTLREELLRIQNDLLDIGSSLATPEGLPVVTSSCIYCHNSTLFIMVHACSHGELVKP